MESYNWVYRGSFGSVTKTICRDFKGFDFLPIARCSSSNITQNASDLGKVVKIGEDLRVRYPKFTKNKNKISKNIKIPYK